MGGLKPEEIAAIEAELGCALPDDLRKQYATSDGLLGPAGCRLLYPFKDEQGHTIVAANRLRSESWFPEKYRCFAIVGDDGCGNLICFDPVSREAVLWNPGDGEWIQERRASVAELWDFVNRSAVHLQSLGPQDEAEVHRLLCVPEVYEYLADGAEPPPSVTADWISTAAGDSLELGGGIWALTFPRERGILGVVRLADDGKDELELTYLLHPDLWGLGYATRMAHTAMNHAFGTGRVSAVWAGADVPNAASIAVMERLGMRFRRKVDYPAGDGVEYAMDAGDFDGSRFELLPIV